MDTLRAMRVFARVIDEGSEVGADTPEAFGHHIAVERARLAEAALGDQVTLRRIGELVEHAVADARHAGHEAVWVSHGVSVRANSGVYIARRTVRKRAIRLLRAINRRATIRAAQHPIA